MAWLYAAGPEGRSRRWLLPPGEVVVGRPSGQAEDGKLPVEGDPLLSRQHFRLTWDGSRARVVRCAEARNPVFFLGQANDDFGLEPGQHFVVGRTEFQLVLQDLAESPRPAQEFTLAHAAREEARGRQARYCLSALVRLLPRLREAAGEEAMWRAAVDVLEGLLPGAACLMALQVDRGALVEGASPFYQVLQDVGTGDRPRALSPSRRLLARAFASNETALHLWDRASTSEGLTEQAGVAWALAAPVGGGPRDSYALYAVGGSPARASWDSETAPGQSEKVLVDLVAETLSHHLAVRRSNLLEAQFGRFFSPVLRRALSERGLEAIMAPVRREVTVLFFDLRGFSRAAEEAGDALEQTLRHHETLTEVMTLVAGCVFAEEGIVLDYQGDALMACWGAPFETSDHAERAVRTAREVVARIHTMDLPFGKRQAERRAPMRCGLGLGTGEVVAGQVGARGQVKFGLMGTVVNQASRLEGLTKWIGVPVLITSEVRRRLPPVEPCRRVGRVRPAGMADVVDLYEVVVPREHAGSGLAPPEIEAYETAVDRLAEGRILETLEALRGVPVDDPVGSFLTRKALQYQAEGTPPGWSGVLEFQAK